MRAYFLLTASALPTVLTMLSPVWLKCYFSELYILQQRIDISRLLRCNSQWTLKTDWSIVGRQMAEHCAESVCNDHDFYYL